MTMKKDILALRDTLALTKELVVVFDAENVEKAAWAPRFAGSTTVTFSASNYGMQIGENRGDFNNVHFGSRGSS